MAYCKFQADHLFTGAALLSQNHVLITDHNGVIADIVDEAEAGDDIQRMNGILMPGMINAHCHLELSHMRDKIPPGGGLTQFIARVMKTRHADEKDQQQHMATAAAEMYQNGIEAVGDICNNASSANVKSHSSIYWHNFLELANLDDDRAEAKLVAFKQLAGEFKSVAPDFKTVMVPHAPYSVSPETLRRINELTAHQTISIHNQETAAENELFERGTGPFLDFYRSIGRQENHMAVSGNTSLQTWLPFFTNHQQIILVHNTFISEEDIVFARNHAQQFGLQLYYCLCPNANLYIENRMPPIGLLMRQGCKIVLGTDSYCSNRQLSMVSEMAAVKRQHPEVPMELLLTWATSNGAEALGVSDHLGSFNKGLKPGIIQVSGNLHDITRLF